MMDRRGQAFTLEAILAAVLLVSSLVFAVQGTAVSPASSSVSSTNPAVQRASVAAGVLDATVEDGSAARAMLAWNQSADAFSGASQKGYFVTGGPPNEFGETLEAALGDGGMAYNVDLRYLTADGSVATRSLVDQGTPTDHATRAVRTVTLYDDDHLTRLDGTEREVTLANATSYFAPDAAPDSDLYNVVRVEVTVWRS